MTEHFSPLYSVTILYQNPGRRAIALDHHVYDQLSNMWLRRSSETQPFVMLTVTPARKDYADLGFPLKSRTRSSILPLMADTGCQSCLGGMRLLPRLGITADDLIPVSMKMHAVNGKGINILGAAILRFSCKSPYGEPRETRQITYITENSDKRFLSREACISLGMITAMFPMVGEAISPSYLQLACAGSTDETDIDTHRCDCTRRQKPRPVPTKLPYAAHGENRSKLQEYLLDYYSSTTFNTCEHQLLPMMQGPPLRPMVDPDASPVANNTPVPVPVHWQEEVKAGLDRDVRLSVIEPVPVGDPVTYCHRMVICAKTDGTPMRTVDMQSLNANATWETHHTQSPFLQAR